MGPQKRLCCQICQNIPPMYIIPNTYPFQAPLLSAHIHVCMNVLIITKLWFNPFAKPGKLSIVSQGLPTRMPGRPGLPFFHIGLPEIVYFCLYAK